MENIYDFEVQKSNGENYKLDVYKGDVMLIVNTASECGFTPQFEGLQELYNKYKDQGFIVLGFPCNQFGGQEPGSVLKQIKIVKLTTVSHSLFMKKLTLKAITSIHCSVI